MANSLRAKLSKLRHDRHITEEEYQAFIKKIDGHDMQIRAEALKPIQKLLDDWFCDRVDDSNWVLSQISICIYEMTKEQKNESK